MSILKKILNQLRENGKLEQYKALMTEFKTYVENGQDEGIYIMCIKSEELYYPMSSFDERLKKLGEKYRSVQIVSYNEEEAQARYNEEHDSFVAFNQKYGFIDRELVIVPVSEDILSRLKEATKYYYDVCASEFEKAFGKDVLASF